MADDRPNRLLVDISNLSASDIDRLSPNALREALKSVLRSPGGELMHRDHNSHSNHDSFTR